MPDEYEGPERRENCDNCVKDDFSGLVEAVNELAKKVSKIIGASGWQKTIVIMLLAGGLSGSVGSIYVVMAKADIDSDQTTEIALVKNDLKNLTESVDDLVTTIQEDKQDLKKYRQEESERQEEQHKAFLDTLERIGK